MSVVAGCSLFHGVLLAADCRATILRPNEAPIYVDNVQKLFVLKPSVAFGFVGDILAAAAVLRELPNHLRARVRDRPSRSHPLSVLDWFPRYLRHKYSKIMHRRPAPLSVMVGCVIRDRPNVIERAKVVALMERFRLGKLSYQRSWLPGILVKILSTPAEVQFVRLMDAPLGLLCILRSPDFAPEFLGPLEFGAIGSGEGVVTQGDVEADWIFAGDVGNPFVETMALRECITHFMADNNIPTVGGLYPCVRLDGKGVHLIGENVEIPIGGDKIELKPSQQGRWVQRHVNSGTEIPLKYPWEIDLAQYSENQTFDYLKEAEENFRGPKKKVDDNS